MNRTSLTALASLLGLVTLSQSALAAEPPSRQEIMALGKSVEGYSYWWGKASWDPTNVDSPGQCNGGGCPSCTHSPAPSSGPEYGSDCSGLIGHAWKLAGTSSPIENSHPYSTHDFRWTTAHWSQIDRADLLPGDALVRNDSGGGHIVLFESWASDGNINMYECSGCEDGCIHSTRSVSSSYIAIRLENVSSAPKPVDGGELTQASCDGISGWAAMGPEPLEVVLSFDAPSGSYFAKRQSVTADQAGECGDAGSCQHAFELPFPDSLKNGKRHALYAYAVDPESGEERLLLGAPVSVRCEATTSAASGCGHGACKTGAALDSECDACTASVCLSRPSCCEAGGSWDASCVALAGESVNVCAGACAGGNSSCQHDECSEGLGLTASCSSCATHVCERDEFCCSHDWDFICVNEAEEDPFCDCGS